MRISMRLASTIVEMRALLGPLFLRGCAIRRRMKVRCGRTSMVRPRSSKGVPVYTPCAQPFTSSGAARRRHRARGGR
eukprot:3234330-Prymnesium_polylepis.1